MESLHGSTENVIHAVPMTERQKGHKPFVKRNRNSNIDDAKQEMHEHEKTPKIGADIEARSYALPKKMQQTEV